MVLWGRTGRIHKTSYRGTFRKKKFSRNTTGTRPEVWKQCPVHVICCISGRRALRVTLKAAQNPGNYRNSQAVGKAFRHSGFLHQPSTHTGFAPFLMLPCVLQKRTDCRTQCLLGGCQGMNTPAPTAARLLDTSKPTTQLLH